jgi:hypothetical protein
VEEAEQARPLDSERIANRVDMDYTKRTLDFLGSGEGCTVAGGGGGGGIIVVDGCTYDDVSAVATMAAPMTTPTTITPTTTTTTAISKNQPRRLVVSVPMTLEQRLKGLPIRYMCRQKVIINLLCRRVCELNAIFISYANGEQELLLSVNDLCHIFCNWDCKNLSPLMSFKKTVYRRVRAVYKVSTGQLIQFVGREKYAVGNDSLNTIYFDEYGFFMVSMLSTRLDTDEIRSSIYATLMDAFGTPLGVQFMRSKRTVDFGVYSRLIAEQQDALNRLSRRLWFAEMKERNDPFGPYPVPRFV